MSSLKTVAYWTVSVAGLTLSSTVLAQTAPAQPAAAPPIAAPPPVMPAPAPQVQSAPAPAAPAAVQPVAPPPVYAPAPAVPPGQPYAVVDPSSGQLMLLPPYGTASRPVPSELPYVEGAPIPRGYAMEEYHPRGLIIAGAVTFGTLYAISMSAAAGGNFDSANGWLAVPVIGPFGWLAARKAPACTDYLYDRSCESDESGKRTMVALDGLGQVAGAAMLIAGIAITRKHLVLVNPQEAVVVAPYASSTGSGLRLIGRF